MSTTQEYFISDEDFFGPVEKLASEAQLMRLFMPDEYLPHEKLFINDIDVFGKYQLAPVSGDNYFFHNYSSNGYVVLFRNAVDNKKYFLYESDNFEVPHPFDSAILFREFDTSDRKAMGPEDEFIYKGKDILGGIKLEPWYVDKNTGEIKSWFKYDGARLHYKTATQKVFLKRAEDFNISHPYKYMFELKYGYKIQMMDNSWYYMTNPKNTIYLGNITGFNGAFLDIISYEKVYEKEPAKYNLLKRTVFKMLADNISEKCKCDRNDIHLPCKTIVCVFKHNTERIKKELTGRPKPLRTKKGNISKKKPEPTAPYADVIKSIGTLAYMLNQGRKPDLNFYNCETCESESVCIYKEQMASFHKTAKEQLLEAKLAEYRKKHGHNPLFPEFMLAEITR